MSRDGRCAAGALAGLYGAGKGNSQGVRGVVWKGELNTLPRKAKQVVVQLLSSIRIVSGCDHSRSEQCSITVCETAHGVHFPLFVAAKVVR